MNRIVTPLIAFVFTALTTSAQWKGWGNPTGYALSDPAFLVHTADITGDGKGDLTTFFSASRLSFAVLQGRGDGSFLAARYLAKEDNYHLSDIADLNKDGYPDLVISSYWSNGFKIYFGSGGYQFGEGVYMATGVHGRAVRCVDINKDGNTDIIAITSGSGRTISLHVFLGKGDGSFHLKQTFPSVLDTSKEIFITDKNSDGLPDVVVSSSFPWFVLFLQQPDGSFQPTYQPTYTTAQLGFADLDHDGREDALLLYSSFDNNPDSDSLVVRYNTGGDSFSSGTQVSLLRQNGIRPSLFRISDLNQDGNSDLLFSHLDADGNYSDTVFYMLGKGALGFNPPVAQIMPAAVVQMQLADFTGDGYPEWVIACSNNYLYVLPNQGSEHTDAELTVEVYPNPAGSAAYLKTNAEAPYRANLYAADGRLVKSWQFSTPFNPLPLAEFARGMYFLEVLHPRGKGLQKLMIR